MYLKKIDPYSFCYRLLPYLVGPAWIVTSPTRPGRMHTFFDFPLLLCCEFLTSLLSHSLPSLPDFQTPRHRPGPFSWLSRPRVPLSPCSMGLPPQTSSPLLSCISESFVAIPRVPRSFCLELNVPCNQALGVHCDDCLVFSPSRPS